MQELLVRFSSAVDPKLLLAAMDDQERLVILQSFYRPLKLAFKTDLEIYQLKIIDFSSIGVLLIQGADAELKRLLASQLLTQHQIVVTRTADLKPLNALIMKAKPVSLVTEATKPKTPK